MKQYVAEKMNLTVNLTELVLTRIAENCVVHIE